MYQREGIHPVIQLSGLSNLKISFVHSEHNDYVFLAADLNLK